MFLQQCLYTVQRVSKVFIQEESLNKEPLNINNRQITFASLKRGWVLAGSYLLFAHPVVNLLCISIEELQVHALLILLPAHLPQLQQGLLLLG